MTESGGFVNFNYLFAFGSIKNTVMYPAIKQL